MASLGMTRAASALLAATIVVAGCGESVSESTASKLLSVTDLDTLVSVESGLLGRAGDLAVSEDGYVYAIDGMNSRVLVVGPDGATETFGQRGAGPGELDTPMALLVTDDGLAVVDRGNGRVQHLSRLGEFLSSSGLPPEVLKSRPVFGPSGDLLVGTLGADSALVKRFDSNGAYVGSYGEPVVPPIPLWDLQKMKAEVRDGRVPAEFRNNLLVAAEAGGGVWVALQSEGEVRRYAADGGLRWTKALEESDRAASLERFYRLNAEEKDPFSFHPLMYFADIRAVGDEVWALLATEGGQPATVLALGPDGETRARIDIPGAGGANRMVYDSGRNRLILATPDDAQIVAAALKR